MPKISYGELSRYAINQLVLQLYLGSQTTCATIVEQ